MSKLSIALLHFEDNENSETNSVRIKTNFYSNKNVFSESFNTLTAVRKFALLPSKSYDKNRLTMSMTENWMKEKLPA